MCKSFFTLVLCLCLFMNLGAAAFAADVEINETNFPDATFRSYVSSNFDTDSSNVLSDEEIANATYIDVSRQNISSLKGIEFFTALTHLWCFENQLTALDVSNNTALIHLWCSDNQLTALDVSKNTVLTILDCPSNQLTALDVSKNTVLTYLECIFNQLTTLDISNNTALTNLDCSGNRLTTLDVSNNTALMRLECDGNKLIVLDVSKNTDLRNINCSYNQLATLELIGNTLLTNEAYSIENVTYLHGGLIAKGQEISVDALTTSDNSSYSYKINFSAFTSRSDFADRISSIDAKTSSGSTVTVSKGTDAVYFSAKPSTMTYVYDTKAPSVVSSDMNVTVNFTSSTDTNTGTDTGTETGSDVVAINETNFPDANFRSYVSSNFDTDSSGGLSSSEIANGTFIDVDNQNISSLKGVEFFTALGTLYCSNNQLTALDVSNNTALTRLTCFNNQLTALNINKNIALDLLDCAVNQLTTLDVSYNTILQYLYCANNQLTALDVSKNTALIRLECFSNQLTTLDVSKNTTIQYLHCSSNQLTALDVSYNTALIELSCTDNQLIELDLSKNAKLTSLVPSNLGNQAISSSVAPSYDSSNSSYPYKFFLSSLSSASDFGDRISSIDAKSSTGSTVTVSKGTDAVYFSAQPSTMTYIYDTKAPSTVSGDMDVTINFTTSANDDGSTTPDEGTSVNSRSYIHSFTMTDSLRNSILAAFPGLSASEIFQFTGSEILEESWTLDNSDSSAITGLGENIAINLPSVMPSNTGVYVMRYSIDSSLVGKNLKVRGISSSSSVSTSNLEDREYTFFDSNYNKITNVPSDGVVYAAVRMTAGQTSRGVITTANELAIGTVQALPEASRDNTLINNIVNTWNENPNRDTSINISDVKFIESKDIYPPQEAPIIVTDKAKSDNANLVGKLSTLSVDKEGYYVFHVVLSDDLAKEVESVDVGQLRIYHAIYESGDVLPSTVEGKVRGSFLLGLLNTFELLTMSGEKMQFGAKEFLMVGFLNAGKPLSLYIAKIILSLLLGGCNSGLGLFSFATLIGGFLLIVKKKRSRRQ